MKKDIKYFIYPVLLSLLIIIDANASDNSSRNAKKNVVATRNYYTQLALGKTQPLAELTLFATMLPKGADLHHHYSGAIYAETYLDWVDLHGYCINKTTDAALNIEKYRIEVKPTELSPLARAQCISAMELRKDNTLYRELLQRWSDKDYENHYHDQPAPDKQFFDTFGYFGPASNSDFNKGLQSLKTRALAENVNYLETMVKSSPAIENQTLNNLLDALDSTSSPKEIDEAFTKAYEILINDVEAANKINNYIESMDNALIGINDDNFTLRLQAYVSRNEHPAKIFSGLYSAFVASKRSSMIVGINIVGPENGYVALRDYSLHMKMFAFLKQRFPDEKLSLHAGELVGGLVMPEDLRYHITEAVMVAGANRIGHGVDIANEANAFALLRLLKQRDIAIEVNLSSNDFILGIKNEAHPLLLYKKYGVPFVISSDDAGVSRTELSGEYLLFISRYKPSYDELKAVVYNSIRYSFLSDVEKSKEFAKLDNKFLNFESLIAENQNLLNKARKK